MKKEYLKIDNLQVAYLEQNKMCEKVIFFVHGNSLSSKNWEFQLNSPQLKEFRLIAIDLPAHGDTNPFPENDYNLKTLGNFLAQAVKALTRESPYIFAGISLGTNIIAEALAHNLKPDGIVLISSCIIGKGISLESIAMPGTNVHVVFTDDAKPQDVNSYAHEAILRGDPGSLENFINDYHKVKDNFRSKLYTSIQLNKYSDQIDLVKSLNLPILIIFGENDYVINTHYLDKKELNLWEDKIHRLSKASHLVNIDAPEQFDQLLFSYSKSMFK